MRKINQIILHCSATQEGKSYTVEDIDRWHKQRGFKCIGYHYVIYLGGTIAKGRPDYMVGAHCTGQNSNSIGICTIGGVDKNNKPKDTRTEEQKVSLIRLVEELMEKHHLTINDVHMHNEYASKACPSYSKTDFLNDYYKYRKQL